MRYDAQQIKARASLLEIVGGMVELKKRGRAWWGCCPFHAENTPSFKVDPDKGLWYCFGCQRSGDVITFVQQAQGLDFLAAVTFLAERYHVAPESQPPPQAARRADPPASPRIANPEWLPNMRALCPFIGEDGTESPAVAYLRGRGIPPLFPRLAGAWFHPDWYGYARGEGDALRRRPGPPRPAVVFEIRDEGGKVVALQGRYFDSRAPKCQTLKRWIREHGDDKHNGVYLTPEALAQPYAVICEAPIDALSLAVCGVSALAVIGTSFPAWLPERVRGCAVYTAFDRDEPGEKGAQKLCDALAVLGTPTKRLMPTGAKDWNELLQRMGREGMAAALAEYFPHLRELQHTAL